MFAKFRLHARGLLPASTYFYYRVIKAQWSFGDEFDVLRPLLRPDDNVVDAGANIGIFSRFFSRYCATVFAYEPDPELYKILCRYAAKNVVGRQLGLSDHSGSAILATPIHGNIAWRGIGSVAEKINPGELAVDIKLTRLDDQNLQRIRLLKVDVEGHEISLLRGGERLLREQRPYIWIEVEQRFYGSRSITEVFREIEAYGYRGYFFEHRSKHSVSEYNGEQYAHTNNFLFEPA